MATEDTAPVEGAEQASAPADTTDWKAEARKHEARSKKAAKDIEDLRAQLEQHADAAKSEQDKAIDDARKQADKAAREDVAKSYRDRILNAEIRAQAAGKFANPALAARLLDLSAEDAFGADDEPDAAVIAAAIDSFLKCDENAGLRVSSGAAPLVNGGADAGKGAATTDLDARIREATEKGDVKTMIGLKRQQKLRAA